MQGSWSAEVPQRFKEEKWIESMVLCVRVREKNRGLVCEALVKVSLFLWELNELLCTNNRIQSCYHIKRLTVLRYGHKQMIPMEHIHQFVTIYPIYTHKAMDLCRFYWIADPGIARTTNYDIPCYVSLHLISKYLLWYTLLIEFIVFHLIPTEDAAI